MPERRSEPSGGLFFGGLGTGRRVAFAFVAAKESRLLRSRPQGLRSGWTPVQVAERLDEALSLLDNVQFDAVLLDLSLPDSHGLDTLHSMCAAAEQVPIVVLTGLDDRDAGVEAVRLGAQDYLVKDQFGAPLLERAVRYAVERKRIEKEERLLMQMKEDFISLVSHQLRTPLTSVSGFLELLYDGKVADPAIREEFLGRAYGEVQKLVTLVESLLNLSRLESGQLPLNREAFDLRELVTDRADSMERIASAKGVTLHCSTPEASVMVMGDRKWLGEVVTNLLTNAVKFSRERGPVYVLCRVKGNAATVAVRDEGAGIAEEELTRVFDRFYQAKSAAKKAGVGTGLGLYIAKGIVEAHGGTMGVKSKENEGSTFFFTLPLHHDGNG